LAQAEALDVLLAGRETKVTNLIALSVDDEEIVKRLLERGKTSGRKDDQNEKVIRKRIVEYNEKTSPVYNYYDKANVSTKVNGIGTLADVFNRVYDLLK
jgi:adenylate kinase